MQRILIIILSIVRKLKSEFSGKTFSRLNFEKPSSVEEPLPQELLAKIANCAIYTPLFKGWLMVFLAVQNSSIGDLVPWSVGWAPLTIRVFTTLQSDPRDL